MKWTRTIPALLLATVLASPALAQEGHEGMNGHGEKKAHGHMEMRMMHAPMGGMLAAHAEELDLSDDQRERLEGLDARMEAEKERHMSEMRSIHESAMEVLTPEQRERMRDMMEEKHERKRMRHGEMDDDYDNMMDHDDHEDEDHGG